jgi:hypothetical protein
LHKHAVAGSGASTPNLFCNQPVHRHGLSFTVRFAFIISYHDSSTCLFPFTRRPVSPVTLIRHCHRCKKKVHRAGSFFAVLFTDCTSCCAMSKWLFAVTRNRKSSITEKLFKNSPRAVRVAVKLSACCELSTETNFQKGQPSPTLILQQDLSTVTCPAAPGLQRLCLRSGGLSKPRPVPETKRGTKITLIAYTSPPPLRKHFVGGWAVLISYPGGHLNCRPDKM